METDTIPQLQFCRCLDLQQRLVSMPCSLLVTGAAVERRDPPGVVQQTAELGYSSCAGKLSDTHCVDLDSSFVVRLIL
jgi:hypothetical protein